MQNAKKYKIPNFCTINTPGTIYLAENQEIWCEKTKKTKFIP